MWIEFVSANERCERWSQKGRPVRAFRHSPFDGKGLFRDITIAMGCAITAIVVKFIHVPACVIQYHYKYAFFASASLLWIIFSCFQLATWILATVQSILCTALFLAIAYNDNSIIGHNKSIFFSSHLMKAINNLFFFRIHLHRMKTGIKWKSNDIISARFPTR